MMYPTTKNDNPFQVDDSYHFDDAIKLDSIPPDNSQRAKRAPPSARRVAWTCQIELNHRIESTLRIESNLLR